MEKNEIKDSLSFDIIDVAKNIAKEKGIDEMEVIEAMEMAIAKAGRTKYGFELDIRAHVDKETGKIGLYRYQEVVEDIEILPSEERINKINISDLKNKSLKIGEFLREELPPLDFGRIAVQTAKQVIFQKVKEAEKIMQFNEFKDKVGEIVNGIVKRVEYGNLIVDLGKGEAILRREELLNREVFRRSDRIRAYINEVKHDLKGPQIFLSRAHNNFLVKLFFQEVPEIYDGIIEVKSVARDPGSRAKIAVYTKEKSIDPVGACVGMRGSRVQAVVNELQGEKIDIVLWSEDIATFVVNGLGPAEVDKVIIEEELKKIDVIVPDEQLSLAIGRKGQNVRLASALTGWSIDILTTSQESDRRNEEFKNLSQKFISLLDVDEVIAHLLVTEGFTSLDEIAMVSLEELTSIEGFDENLSKELIQRAKICVEKIRVENLSKLKESGFDDYLLTTKLLDTDQLLKLNENNIKTRDQLADLSNSELIEIFRDMDQDKADEIIMDSRKHWYKS
ncbi:MAG: transcription termination/antitermination protein NusA [Alphaproteobacteria bacterium]|nr:MAG: transcription termination/antitermination protein NusA [Alphaproteobacteria bacterium]